MATRRVRLIDLLSGLHPDRDPKELYAEVLRGMVSVDGVPVTKPGVLVPAHARVVVHARPAYVSRGGDKLEAAVREWGLPVEGAVWLDAGCSTGGFTDCLLAHGAARVHAVDVGVGQLDWRLRTDPRVTVREGINVMALGPSDLDPPADRAVADLSFRSLRGAAFHILGLAREAWGVFLVKPQFEWAEPSKDFHGVVRDRDTVRGILAGLLEGLASEGVAAEKALRSPIRGQKGNREYLVLLRRVGAPAAIQVAELLRAVGLE
ncbi:MAG TPA: TlyA family RNA methyltransferase [Spirochaetia bacterium]|nr:TlyA family RNA methyltransferase [Spirochaetia bacterium]